MKCLCMVLCLLLVVGLIPSVGLAGSVSEYQQLFTQAASADGAFAEKLARSLGSEFKADPVSFLRALALASVDQIHAVAYLLAYDATYSDLGQYEQWLSELSSGTSFTDAERGVLTELLNAAKKLETTLRPSGAPAPSPPRAKRFEPQTILRLIAAREEAGLLGQLDEEFNHVLGNAYC